MTLDIILSQMQYEIVHGVQCIQECYAIELLLNIHTKMRERAHCALRKRNQYHGHKH